MKASGKAIGFAYGLKSFLGYLEGTQKAAHTIKNYRLDLLSFEKYLGEASLELKDLTQDHLEEFHSYLKTQGLKTNTRRRKLLTVRRFLQYLSKRKKLSMDVGRRLPAPHKIERVPKVFSAREWIKGVRKMSSESGLEARNRVLLWTLGETGCLVSEVIRLRFDQWSESKKAVGFIKFQGKSPRIVAVSYELFEAVNELKRKSPDDSPWLFLGHNKFGSLGSPISSRGVELLFKQRSSTITPRSLRHSVIVEWFKDGVRKEEIQRRLGLKSTYPFRVYEPIVSQFKSSSRATSTSEMSPLES